MGSMLAIVRKPTRHAAGAGGNQLRFCHGRRGPPVRSDVGFGVRRGAALGRTETVHVKPLAFWPEGRRPATSIGNRAGEQLVERSLESYG